MTEQSDDTPKVVSNLNLRIVKLLKEVDDSDFITVLSHPSRLARVAADQQQQQQQQQVKQQ